MSERYPDGASGPDIAALIRTTNDTISRSRGADRPRFASSFALFEIRGRREDRVLAAPAVSRAICANKTAHEHTGQREHSGLPCAMALRLTSCSSRRTALLPPSPAELLLANLAPAPRRPNHTTSPYASGAYVCRALASIASHRAFVTMANAPHRRETGGVMRLIWVRTKAEYFCESCWTQHLACIGQAFDIRPTNQLCSPRHALSTCRACRRRGMLTAYRCRPHSAKRH